MGHAEEGNSPYNRDSEDGPSRSNDQLIVKPISTWKGYIWDTWELPKDQRWLLFKLDAFILTFASVSPTLRSRSCVLWGGGGGGGGPKKGKDQPVNIFIY